MQLEKVKNVEFMRKKAQMFPIQGLGQTMKALNAE